MVIVAFLTWLTFAVVASGLLAGYFWFLGMSIRSESGDGSEGLPSATGSVDRIAA